MGKYVLTCLGTIIVAFVLWLVLKQMLSSEQMLSSDSFSKGATHTISRTENGYEPVALTIAQGDIVQFENATDTHHWPASDLHPTHALYPDFDPRRPLASGESWTFRFRQAGECTFHDHLQANLVGVVTVTPSDSSL